jgi:protein phosphatase
MTSPSARSALGRDQTTPLETPGRPADETSPPEVRAFGLTDRGQVRASNEDQFLIAALSKALQVQQTSLSESPVRFASERGYLLLIADGMGGHRGGEQASTLAVNSIEQFVLDRMKSSLNGADEKAQGILAELEAAIRQTDAIIRREGTLHPELWGMGTTVTLACIFDRELFVVHVGDSRCYLFRDGALLQLTHDHTLLQELLKGGVLRKEDEGNQRWRHVITNVVGGTQPDVHPEVHKLHLEPGDLLLLCSDGLTDMLPDPDIAAILEEEPDPERAGKRLVACANERGGRDNITVILGRMPPLRRIE